MWGKARWAAFGGEITNERARQSKSESVLKLLPITKKGKILWRSNWIPHSVKLTEQR